MPKVKTPDNSWTNFSRAFIIIPLACVLVILAFLAWRAWKNRKPRAIITQAEIKTVPDITGDDVDAGALPEDGWLDLAGELMEKGELRLASPRALSCNAGNACPPGPDHHSEI